MSNWRISALMNELKAFAAETAVPALNSTLQSHGVTEPTNVGGYRILRNSNMPALWHERRTATSTGVDTNTSRDTLYLAVMVGVRFSDEGVADEQIDAMLDVVREVYSRKCRESLPWGVHRAKRFAVEMPIPTEINGIPVLAAGLVLELQLQLPTSWPS